MKKSLPVKIKCAIRKFFSQNVAPNLIFPQSRVLIYKLCGYKIGKNVFIGMKCYLDDLEPEMLSIEDNVIISYGVYFACHGKKQEHYPITVKEGAYVGMRANIISKNSMGGGTGVTIGRNAVIGACALVNIDIPDGATAVGVPCRIVTYSEEQHDGEMEILQSRCNPNFRTS